MWVLEEAHDKMYFLDFPVNHVHELCMSDIASTVFNDTATVRIRIAL